MTMYLVFSACTSRPITLLVTNEYSVFLHGMCVFTQYVHTISINQKLMCTIQFQPLVVCVNPLNNMKIVMIMVLEAT
jgi:hypothetical protein